ncbi:hypothetical protein SARC_16014 [Sphaeroforma arctica JP610]|uniref:Uncharacterized protein n=1 Tax=Sphaeroforma arctica JP610 TaxID=667725 RepID=A0A0L0F432_9EUKA|nr:hypothetical protein SARC_16014 [Sphaeroforma arctica JP610]KNC71447.1 hypothetical protein SARC_16014 [Sphaeroforma arctica JP610]|eukprot:XP_014145349.1 hypothetical protein SARC_16014 [Sphaeroforma arctica JP610]
MDIIILLNPNEIYNTIMDDKFFENELEDNKAKIWRRFNEVYKANIDPKQSLINQVK